MKRLRIKRFIVLFILVFLNCTYFPQISLINIKNIDKITQLSLSNINNNESWIQILQNFPRSISIDSNNCIYVTGSIGSSDSLNVSIIKYSNSGIKLWEEIWGGPERDYYYTKILDSNDNIYLTGSTESYGAGFNDAFLLKYNSSGDLQWSRIWGTKGNEEMNLIEIDLNDSIYICGGTFNYNNRDMVLLKYNNVGDLEWSYIWGGSASEGATSIEVDSNNNVYIYAYSDSSGEKELYLLKYNYSGTLLWTKQIDLIGDINGYNMIIDSDDNILVNGDTYYDNNDTKETWIIQFNSSGAEQWRYLWKTPVEVGFDHLSNIYLTFYNYTKKEMYIIKCNKTLKVLFNITLEIYEYGIHIKVDLLNNIYIISYLEIPSENYYEDIYINKYNSSGCFQWNLTWGGPYWENYYDLAFDSLNNIYLLCRSYRNRYIFFLIKNPISNEKSLEPIPWINPMIYYLFTFVGITCVISIMTLLSIIIPKIQKKFRNEDKVHL